MNDQFRKLSKKERKQLSIVGLTEYYSDLRKYEYDKGKELKRIYLRKAIHFIVNIILKFDQLKSREKIIILSDKHKKSTKPVIYVCTHIGGNDIQRTLQVIKKPAYLMLGDPGILYRKKIYKGLIMNGVIPLETTDKEDRHIAYNRSVELLNKGGNLLIYPEGAWNVSPNLVVMKLFNGAVRLAKETGAEIVPIAVEQYGKKFYFNIGENYTISKEEKKDAKELTDELRDKLVTLKWTIMESQSKLNRDTVPDNYLEDFQNEIVKRCNYGYDFSLEDALNESFHDKNIVTEEEAFQFLETVDIDTHNAFLMKDKLELVRRKK